MTALARSRRGRGSVRKARNRFGWSTLSPTLDSHWTGDIRRLSPCVDHRRGTTAPGKGSMQLALSATRAWLPATAGGRTCCPSPPGARACRATVCSTKGAAPPWATVRGRPPPPDPGPCNPPRTSPPTQAKLSAVALPLPGRRAANHSWLTGAQWTTPAAAVAAAPMMQSSSLLPCFTPVST